MTDVLADVVLHLPPSKARESAVRVPLWRRLLTAQDARAYLADTYWIECALSEAEHAHRHDNPVALTVAVRLLRARPDLRWPQWVSEAVLEMLEQGAPRGRSGRHGDRLTQWLDDAADYTRYRAVEILTADGIKQPTVYAVAEEQLKLDGFASSSDAIKKAHARVKKRIGKSPSFPGELLYAARYYPDIATLHILAAADRAQTP